MGKRLVLLMGSAFMAVGMTLVPAQAAPTYTVLGPSVAPDLSTGVLAAQAGRFTGCGTSPVFQTVTNPDSPGVDSKAIDVATLGLGSSPSARRVKVQTAGAPAAGGIEFATRYATNTCDLLGAADGPGSPLTVTVPGLAKWILVIAVGDPAAVNIQFKAEKV